jgi:hypothetical protein
MTCRFGRCLDLREGVGRVGLELSDAAEGPLVHLVGGVAELTGWSHADLDLDDGRADERGYGNTDSVRRAALGWDGMEGLQREDLKAAMKSW